MSRNPCFINLNSVFMISAITALLFCPLLSPQVQAEMRMFRVAETSELPIYALESLGAKANMIAITGGNGVRNGAGRSQNFLVTQRQGFFTAGINFYLLPNGSKQEKASYGLRNSRERMNRILALVKAISTRNDKPIFLVGFSRGSVDVGQFAKTTPKAVAGVVLASGIYTNASKKAGYYAMERIIGDTIALPLLLVHHEKDRCKVTSFTFAKRFFNDLETSAKTLRHYVGGTASGRACGPRHHHGFEGIEARVVRDIAAWILAPVTGQ